ncbi:MAG: amidohydrolase [Cyclobacteriaceae bacterium]|nr:amidohydrolase [Cyclobacteriaceae bacterium]
MNASILNLRKELHQNPELSGDESNTAQRIKSFITTHHAPTQFIDNVGGHGLLAVYEYPNTGTTVTIRCELDALPIEEDNTFSYKSNVKGISHKCGHDGHMAIVAGLIFWIKEQNFTSGKIVLLFQPAEETGKGGHEVMNDERFKALHSDYIFALHNIPGEPLHRIITTQTGFSAEVQSFALYLKGKESHAAEPEHGINPALAMAKIVDALSQMNVFDPTRDDFAILTPVYITMGAKAYGISPAKGELHYTLRTWNEEVMNKVKHNLQEVITTTCQVHHLECKINWFEYFPASINNPLSVEYIKEVARASGYPIVERPYPFKFGEDFGWFSKEYKTAMFGLGAGTHSPALHHSDYDFPDEIIATGINMFTTLIERVMASSKE